MSKSDFLDHLRVARNLFAHAEVTTNSRQLAPGESAQALTRAAIWLTPSSVKGFRADDFQELGAQKQTLADAVQAFEHLAKQVPSDVPATDQQLKDATVPFQQILTILGNYLPNYEEASQIQAALATLDYPQWVLNWDYALGSDQEGDPAIWITLYADEQAIPPDQYGRGVLEMIPKFRSALKDAGIRRWPYIRLRTEREYKAG